MSLEIAVIGYNRKTTLHMLKRLTENDTGKIIDSTNNSVTMSDGTIYRGVFESRNLDGIRFDQMIITDDERWTIFEKQYDVIQIVKMSLLHSYVPKEYQVIRYPYID
ncbi:MAG: hypothetical protein AB9836_07645 [Aminipila sp.]